MKKPLSILSIIGVLLIIVGLTIAGFNYKKIYQSIINSGNVDYEFKTKEITDYSNLQEIIFDVSGEDLTFKLATEDKITINYVETEDKKIEITENSGTLKLTSERTFKVRFFSLDFSPEKIEVFVPESLLLRYNLKTSNGRIKIDNLTMNTLDAKTSNGSVEVNNVNVLETTYVKTSNGKLIFNNVETKDLTGITSNGRAMLDRVNVLNGSIESSNGSVELSRVQSTRFLVDTSNATIKLNNVSGKVLNFDTSNGKVEGSLNINISDYQRNLKTSNSSITINGQKYDTTIIDTEEKEYKLTIKTSNGKVDINTKS